MRRRIGHERDGLERLGPGGQFAEGAAVDGRVGDQEVVADPLLVEPERLAQCVAHHTAEARVLQHTLDECPAA
jgi:hypothetical protein